MLAGQFSCVESLRRLAAGVNAHPLKHYHLDAGKVRRSTLSDANRGRDASVFRAMAELMMTQAGAAAGACLQEFLTVPDSTPIRVAARGSDWARSTRPGTRGLKLHIQHRAGDIEYAEVTAATVNDITVARGMALKAERIYGFDKGYCDYNWWMPLRRAAACG